MEDVLTCLILLLIVMVSGVIARMNHSLPAPLVQITLGTLSAICFPSFHVGFNPELFMLLFIPPLLFSDSWHFPKREFMSNTRPIIMLSIGLVFFTVAGLGYLLNWLIPEIPLPACFALAAALSPTDAVSLKSLTSGSDIPERLKHILQGEALLNDASGLISFKFAVAAMLTGFFSFADASASLFIVGLGGMLIGTLLSYLIISALGQLSRRGEDETSTENLLLLLLPYAAYLAAEHMGFSGVLAAVAAGFSVDKAGFLDKTMVTMRIEGRFVWGMLESTLNGVIFVMLGLYLPNSYQLLAYTDCSVPECLLLVLIITISLIALRFIWIYLTLPFEALIARHKHSQWSFPNLKVISVIAFGGVRGAIALAAILSLPALMPDGSAFPSRDLLITIVVGVVLCSLILSAIILPLLIPSVKLLVSATTADEEYSAGIAAARAAIEAIANKSEAMKKDLSESEAELCQRVASSLIASLNQLIVSSIGMDHEKIICQRAILFEDILRLAALEGARKELRDLRKKCLINNTTMQEIIHILDLRQLSLLNRNKNT